MFMIQLTAPYTFPKIHGCEPTSCKCRNKRDPVTPFASYLYLEPMAKVIEEFAKQKMNLVTGHKIQTFEIHGLFLLSLMRRTPLLSTRDIPAFHHGLSST